MPIRALEDLGGGMEGGNRARPWAESLIEPMLEQPLLFAGPTS